MTANPERRTSLLSVVSNGSHPSATWVWSSPTANLARVAHLKEIAVDIERCGGYRRLLGSVRDAVREDRYWAERYSISTIDQPWFQDVLTAMAASFSHPLWCPVLVTLLGLSGQPDQHHYQVQSCAAAVRNALSSGELKRIDALLSDLNQESLSELTLVGLQMIPRLVATIAVESKMLGAVGDESIESPFCWYSGQYRPRGPLQLRYSWHDEWAPVEFDEFDVDKDSAEDLPQLYLRRATNRLDPAVVHLRDNINPDPRFFDFIPIETPFHRAELILIGFGEGDDKGIAGCFGLTTTLSEDGGQYRLQLHVPTAVYVPRFEPLATAAMRAIASSVGGDVCELIEDELSKHVPPRSTLHVHVTPQPGQVSWEPFIQKLKEKIEVLSDTLGESGQLGGPHLEFDVHRSHPDSPDSGWPELGRVAVDGEDGKTFKRIMDSSFKLSWTLGSGGPLVLRLKDRGVGITQGYSYEEREISGTRKVEGRDALRELKSPATRRFIKGMFERCELDHDDAVLVIWGGFAQLCVVFSEHVWDSGDWEYMDDTIAHVVFEGSGPEMMSSRHLETFWTMFPSELAQVVAGESQMDYD